jgi:hypothetical protein
MHSKLYKSGTTEFPKPRDLIGNLIERMIKKNHHGSWTHIEIIDKRGWFFNRLFGKGAFMEVALDSESALTLNLGSWGRRGGGHQKPPIKWAEQEPDLFIIPLSDKAALLDWVDRCFAEHESNQEYRIAGYLDGL